MPGAPGVYRANRGLAKEAVTVPSASRYLLFQKAEAALIDEKAAKLFGITRLLDRYLEADFDAIMARASTRPASREERISALNRVLGGFVDDVASWYPGVGVGYFSKEDEAIVAYGPSSDFGSKVGMNLGPDHLGWQAMENRKEVVGVGSMVRGEIMNCMRPLLRDGQAIGFVWANETLSDIYAQIQLGARRVFFSPGIEPLLGLTGLLLFSSRLLLANKQVERLARYLRLFLNSLSLGVILAGPDDSIIFASQGTEAVLGPLSGENSAAVQGSPHERTSQTEQVPPSNHSAVAGQTSSHRHNSTTHPAAENGGPEDFTDKNIRQILQAAGIDPRLALDDPVEGALNRFCTVTIRKEGHPRSITMVSTPVEGEDKSNAGTVLILEDLEEAHLQEERLHRAENLAAVGEIAASIAHEIRNPLTVVMGAISLVPERLDDRGFLENFVRIASDELQRVNQTVESLLNFARFSHPKMAPLSLETAIRRAADVISGYAAMFRVSVETQCQEGLPEIEGDMDHLIQAFLNLMLNSVQAMPEGGLLDVNAQWDGGRYLVVTVRDTGSGIPPECTHQILDMFFTTKKDGTGLGLPLVQRIIDEQRGLMEFESQPGKGTVFTVKLPVTRGGAG